MPAFLVSIAGVLAWVFQWLAARLVFMIGLTVVTYTGVGLFLLDLKDAFIAQYQSMPAVMVQIMGLFKIDQAVLILFAALTSRLTFNTVNDKVSRIVQGTPGSVP